MESTEIKFTSVDYYINKFPDKIKESVIDLEKLATKFSLEGQFDKLEYSEKIGKGSIEKLINRPPIGPIPNNFMCTFCLQYGPDFHLVNCPNPNKRSLVLTFKGFKDLLKNTDYSGPLENDIKEYKKGNRLKILKKYFENDIEKDKKDGKTIIKIPDDAISEIIYDDVVKIKGKDPQAPKTLTIRFSNIVSIYYSYGDKTTNIRIYKDGSIDIKNIPQVESERKEFINTLMNRINETQSINIENFNKLLVKNGLTRVRDYKEVEGTFYLFHCQFYMFGKENRKSQEIQFDKLEEIIEPKSSNSYINIVNGENFLEIDDYDATIVSKSKPVILTETIDNKVYIIDIDGINISLFITKYGVFQFSVSTTQLNIEDTLDILDIIRTFFIDIFATNSLTEKTFISTEPLIYSMHETQDTTVTGLVPPKSQSQRTGTEVCRKTQAGVELQPRPYSWSGNCASENYAPAIGIADKYRGGDVRVNYNGKDQQLYYPCCEKLTGRAKLEFISKLKSGFTQEEQEKYGIFPDKDILSGVIIPGSTKVGAEAEVILPGDSDYTKVTVMEVPKKITPISEYKVVRNSDSKQFKVQRMAFKKDSRYFRGLNTLNKNELISILVKENMVTSGQKIDIKIDIMNNFKYINYTAILEEFTKIVYKLCRVPDNTILVYLDYKNESDQYYLTNNFKLKSSVKFVEGTTVIGFYNENSKDFYPLYINGLNDLDKSTEIIETQLIGKEDTVKEIEYYDNYVEASDYLLKNENNIRLIFVPSDLSSIVYYFDEKLIPDSITVQLIKKLGSSRYIFGYNGKEFTSESYQLVIPQSVSELDYIEVKGRYNKITNEVDKLKPLEFIKTSRREEKSFEKAKLDFNELFDPINIVFFTVNDGEYFKIDSQELEFDEETELLDISPM
jgi:hypothetical protein